MKAKNHILNVAVALVVAFVLLCPHISLALGNGTVDVTPEPSVWSTVQVAFTHDTAQGSLNSTALVIWVADGSSQVGIASTTGSYFYADGTQTLSTIFAGLTLSPGTYKFGAISLVNGCCTNLQMETLWDTETDTNTNSGGYYYTDTFDITAPVSSSTRKIRGVGITR